VDRLTVSAAAPGSANLVVGVELSDKITGLPIIRETLRSARRAHEFEARIPALPGYDLHTARAVVICGLSPAVERRRIAIVPSEPTR
jgi:hypothetical protein